MSDTTNGIESEANATRRRLGGLLEELRSRVSPGEIVDEVIGFTRDGHGKEFGKKLGAQILDNPLPSVLIGAGLAWMFLGDRMSHRASRPSGRTRDRSSDTMAREAGAARRDATNIGAATASAAHDMKDGALSVVSDLQDKAGEVAGATIESLRAGSAHASEFAADAGRRTLNTAYEFGETAADFARQRGGEVGHWLTERPFVTAGIGLAVGAAIGASLSATKAESELLGATADEIKTRVREAAGEQMGKAKSVAAQVFESAKKGVMEAPGSKGDDSAYPAGTLRAEHSAQDESGQDAPVDAEKNEKEKADIT